MKHIHLRNIRYRGTEPQLSLIAGYDDQRCVRNVTFEGLKVNGRTIYDTMPDKLPWYNTADYVPMWVGPHVEGLKFLK